MTDLADFTIGSQLIAPGDLGLLSVANGNINVTGSFTLSPFATGVLVVVFNTSPAVAAVQITGTVSGKIYANLSAGNPASWPPINVAITGASDNPVTVLVALAATNSSGIAIPVCHVYQLFGTAAQIVSSTPSQPLFVTQQPAPTNALFGSNLVALKVGVAIAAAGNSTLIVGATGKVIAVYGYDLSIRANVQATVGVYQGVIEDTTAAVTVASFDMDYATAVGVVGQNHQLWIPPAVLCPLAAGLKLVTAAGNPGAMLFTGTIYYTQLPN